MFLSIEILKKCAFYPENYAFFYIVYRYNSSMQDTTIITNSPIGQHLEKIADPEQVSYLMFNKKKIQLVAKHSIGRDSENDIVGDNKLASRHHAIIQKIKDAYFLKDENSTNGTFLNGQKIPEGKYVRLSSGDKVTIGNMS